MKKTFTIGAVAVAAATFAASARSAQIGYDTLIAHRGESNDAPENTLPAYKMAVERGFGFECDVYLSKDGRVFTFHDRNLKRTTDGANTNRCCDVTWDEISRLDVGGWGKWKGSKYVGTRPALLEEVLALARDGRKIYVEVKPGPEIVPHIKKVFASQGKATPNNTLFISFEKATCKALKEQMPEYKVYWLVSSRHKKMPGHPPVTAADVIAAMRETGADGVDIHYAPDVITAEMVAAVRKAGYEFHVWTVDKLEDTEEAFRRGAQTVTTNCAEAQLKAAEAKMKSGCPR
jgi:glycerophosphoryl diester phosphodiesterase